EREKVWEGMVEVVHGFQREHGLLTNAALEARIHEELRQLLEEAVLPIRCQLGPLQRQGLQHIGPDVLLLKCFLIQEGHELEADLAFDAATAQALRSFQKEHKLPLSGWVDARTLDFINQLRRQLGTASIPEQAPAEDLIE
ncbi:MAG: peptidoglycan-binding domain-containing protein, partial [Candidatus Sericytochromatia bacterium]